MCYSCTDSIHSGLRLDGGRTLASIVQGLSKDGICDTVKRTPLLSFILYISSIAERDPVNELFMSRQRTMTLNDYRIRLLGGRGYRRT